ncbi:MAG TPA: DUF4834 family protein [Bacteroides reticulotermitis]|nr:DUF4834 family protein [Bacteroides reticulotermitis]
MHILLFILIFFVCLLGIGLSIIGTILRAVFGIGRSKRQPHYEQTRRNYGDQHTNTGYGATTSDNEEEGHNKKIFSKDEGEYVDFEEVKE